MACIRNHIAVADHIANKHNKIAVIGAGTRGEFRSEDQMACAWLAEKLMQHGYTAENEITNDLVKRWRGVSPELIRKSPSADYLRNSGQGHDLEFIIHHINDLAIIPKYERGELIDVSTQEK